MIFDTHAHYTDEQFDCDRDELLSSMNKNNVGLIMNACSSIDEIPKILELAEKYSFIYAAVGVHPEAVLKTPDDYIEQLARFAEHKKVKAIGEIGLDYHWTNETKTIQQQILGEQVDFARELKLPVIIHDR